MTISWKSKRMCVAVGVIGLSMVSAVPIVVHAASPSDPLFGGFLQPPPEAYPSGGGSATQRPDAQRAALERLKGFGVSVARLGGTYPAGYMTPEWKKQMADAFGFIGSMGFKTGFNISPGFSHTGDYFVKPEEAMKTLVWTKTRVDGGKHFSGMLAAPSSVAGPFQGIPLSNEGPATIAMNFDFYRDVMVLAYRVPDSATATPAAVVTSSNGPVDAKKISTLTPLEPTRLSQKDGSVWLQFDYPEVTTIRSATLASPENRENPAIAADVRALGDNGQYTSIATMVMRNANQTTVSFPPVRAKSFRFVLTRAPVARRGINGPGETVPNPGPPGPRPGTPFYIHGRPDVFPIAGAWLNSDGLVNEYERKAGFFPHVYDYYELDTSPKAVNAVTPKTQVIDITQWMRGDGQLEWTPPAGKWEIIRFGYTSTGKNNHPAGPDATGLEADKFNATCMDNYFERFLSGIMPTGPEKKFVTTVFSDSIETGPQTWSQEMLMEFKKRRGYDPLPYLPAMTGVVIDSAEATDKFLWDYRQTIADLIQENTYKRMSEVAHKYGLKTIVEALEQNRHNLGDDYEMRRWADIPAGAIWSGWGRVNYFKDAPQQVADLKGASSVAHVYGHKLVAAESGTNLGNPNNFSPKNLKPMKDLEFALGVNWLLRGPPAPNEPWAAAGSDWVRYLARSSYMIQQGKFVADVAYYYGQEAPLIALGERLNDTPKSNGFDYINTEALMQSVKVENGKLVTVGGMEYRVLQIGGASDRLTVATLRRLRDLVQSGLVIVGKPPQSSPSLADDPAEFAGLRTEIWGSGGKLGQGRVYTGTVDAALASEGIGPDLSARGGTPGVDLIFNHRRVADGDFYFVMWDRADAANVELSFRQTGKAPELWRADTGESTPLSYRTAGGRTVVNVHINPSDAMFIVFREPATASSRTVSAPTRQVTPIDGIWTVTFPARHGAPEQVNLAAGSYTANSDPGVKYFSGIATYSRTLDVPTTALQGGKLILSLGDVGDVAELRVNGTQVGFRWTQPYDFDITSVAKAGANQIEVKVSNLMVNRMIGDAQPGATKIGPSLGLNANFKPDAMLRPSGIIGPVALVHEH